jgi:hypothetical protein
LATVKLWINIDPPLGRRRGASEIDIAIGSPAWVWFIEARYRNDISHGTATRPDRDQVLRNIDVGSYCAGVRPCYFNLLTISTEKSLLGRRGKIACTLLFWATRTV